MRHSTWMPGLIAAALCGCAGSGSSSETDHNAQTDADGGSASGVFVGEVEDSDVRVAVLLDDSHVRLFFCGGADSVADKTHWFNLTKDPGDVAVARAEDDAALSAAFDLDAVSGDYSVGGERHAYTAQRVAKGTLSGLYEGKGECGRLGLIVRQSAPNAEITAQGACVGNGHTPEQVNPILPLSSQDGKIRVRAPGQSDDDILLLQAAGTTPL